MDITFANKEYLWLLLLLVPLIGWYVWRHKKQHAHLNIPSTLPYGRFLKSTNIFQHIQFGLLGLTLASLIFAMARPQTSLSWEKTKTEGIDIIVSLDISVSMLAKDFQPNRLESAKDVAMEFITNRPNDRIGLVVFSGESFTQSPLTTDQRILLNLFSTVQINDAIDGGTAIGNGLATAVNRLRESDAKSKVIILLTDGENNRGTIAPETASELAEKFGIKVYTIGMGTMGTARAPVGITPGGQYVYGDTPVTIDENLLRSIAQKTGGKYFRATNTSKLREIYKEIDQLEKTEIQKDRHTQYNEAFHLFGFLALGLLSLYLLLKLWILKTTP